MYCWSILKASAILENIFIKKFFFFIFIFMVSQCTNKPYYLCGMEKYFSSYFYPLKRVILHTNILLFLSGEKKYFSSNYGIKICYFLFSLGTEKFLFVRTLLIILISYFLLFLQVQKCPSRFIRKFCGGFITLYKSNKMTVCVYVA